MKSLLRNLATALILASFVTVALLSFAVMVHGPDGSMANDCPFPAMGQSACPPGAASLAIHHISAFNEFLSVPASFGILVMVLSMLLLIGGLISYFNSSSLSEPPYLRKYLTAFPRLLPSQNKTTRWLSLFENSPSYI